MAKLKTDSPLSRRVVLSFLQFLNSVEPAPGVDLEGLEVAKECLAEVFKIDPSSIDNQPNTDSLIDIFHSLEASEQRETNPNLSRQRFSLDVPVTSSAPSSVNAKSADLSCSEGEDWTRDPHALGVSKDELFGQFFGALENIRYFKSRPDGNDDQVQLDRASQAFHSALENMQKSGCETFDRKNLAETFKSQGNKVMQSKLYYEAIQLYTFAIALCQDNAVYYSNRAAAYTQLHYYAGAIEDCLKAIEIDPNYSKAYSRLGFVYYAQGKFRDAIDKGFMKALQLDPNNESVKENIRVAEQKLREEQQRTGHDQGSSSASHHRESTHQSAGGSRTSMPFNANGLPPDIASMLRNMTANVFQGEHFQGAPEVHINTDAPNDPGIRMGGNVNVNIGEQMPEELSGTLRSVMEMFSGAGAGAGASPTPPGSGEDNMNRRPAPS